MSGASTRGDERGRLPNYVVGPVVSIATHVTVTLSNRMVLEVPTISPPSGLTKGLSFYAVEKPCGPYPVSIVGRDRIGHIVASWTRTGSPPALLRLKGHLGC